jgi:hypothetical protein
VGAEAVTASDHPCPICGSAYVHLTGPCPLAKAEHQQRMRHAELEHEARMQAIRASVCPQALPRLPE